MQLLVIMTSVLIHNYDNGYLAIKYTYLKYIASPVESSLMILFDFRQITFDKFA